MSNLEANRRPVLPKVNVLTGTSKEGGSLSRFFRVQLQKKVWLASALKVEIFLTGAKETRDDSEKNTHMMEVMFIVEYSR